MPEIIKPDQAQWTFISIISLKITLAITLPAPSKIYVETLCGLLILLPSLHIKPPPEQGCYATPYTDRHANTLMIRANLGAVIVSGCFNFTFRGNFQELPRCFLIQKYADCNGNNTMCSSSGINGAETRTAMTYCSEVPIQCVSEIDTTFVKVFYSAICI